MLEIGVRFGCHGVRTTTTASFVMMLGMSACTLRYLYYAVDHHNIYRAFKPVAI